jgi:hypothetical protein
MPDTTGKEKIIFAKELRASGTTRVADIQKAVKKKFGTGMDFRDIGKVFPKKRGLKKKAKKKTAKMARKRGKKKAARAPRRKTGLGRRGRGRGPDRPPMKRMGRPPANEWILMAGNEGEQFTSRRALESRVAELVANGTSPGNLAVYERKPMRMTVKVVVRV